MTDPSDLGASYAPLDERERRLLRQIERRLRLGHPGLNLSLKTGKDLGPLTRAEELAHEYGVPVGIMVAAIALAGAVMATGRNKR